MTENQTFIGTVLGSLVLLGGSLLTWLATRGQTGATFRQGEIEFIVKNLRVDLERVSAELKEVRAENDECYADRDQMRNELRRIKASLNLDKDGNLQ